MTKTGELECMIEGRQRKRQKLTPPDQQVILSICLSWHRRRLGDLSADSESTRSTTAIRDLSTLGSMAVFESPHVCAPSLSTATLSPAVAVIKANPNLSTRTSSPQSVSAGRTLAAVLAGRTLADSHHGPYRASRLVAMGAVADLRPANYCDGSWSVLTAKTLRPKLLDPKILSTNVLDPNVLGPKVLGTYVLGPKVLGPNVLVS